MLLGFRVKKTKTILHLLYYSSSYLLPMSSNLQKKKRYSSLKAQILNILIKFERWSIKFKIETVSLHFTLCTTVLSLTNWVFPAAKSTTYYKIVQLVNISTLTCIPVIILITDTAVKTV